MPLVECPSCKRHLRYRFKQMRSRSVTLRCPVCKAKMSLCKPYLAGPNVLSAHGDPQITQQLADRFELLGIKMQSCPTAAAVKDAVSRSHECLLLLDVAFAGSFPFDVIAEVKGQQGRQHKVILLPSVYNRTAYKKKPTSLYGADDYLELHHIGDRLLPLVAELYPALQSIVTPLPSVRMVAAERELFDHGVAAQAQEFSRLLIADIVFYHQQELRTESRSGQVLEVLAAPLAEGRRLLAERLPAAAALNVDFIGEAFAELYQHYSEVTICELDSEVSCGIETT